MPSTFDALYFELFGHECSKEGQAFERIAAAVSKIVYPEANVTHDIRLRGQISNSLYQIDVQIQDNAQQAFGEAKDYSVQEKKVGRADLQKLAGALLEVNAHKGVFYSATDYTTPAKKYAEGANVFLNKPIDLLHIRPSVEEDENGRIKKIIINLHVFSPDLSNAQFSPVWTNQAQITLSNWLKRQAIDSATKIIPIDTLFDSHGTPIVTVTELTSGGFDGDFEVAQGCFSLPDHYLKFEDMLLGIRGIEYYVPFLCETRIIEIDSSGAPKILIKAENGTIDKLITDEQLKRISFNQNGEVVLSPQISPH